MAAQVELTYTFTDKHEEKKTVSVTPDAKGVVTVIVSAASCRKVWSGCRCCRISPRPKSVRRVTT